MKNELILYQNGYIFRRVFFKACISRVHISKGKYILICKYQGEKIGINIRIIEQCGGIVVNPVMFRINKVCKLIN